MAEQYYTVPKDPQYDEKIRKIQNDDPVNADTIVNPVIEALMQNTAAVKKQADSAVKQVDDLADKKADANHTHTKDQITDFPASIPPTSHTHTKSQITDFPTSMPPTSHASSHSSSGSDPITPDKIGAAPTSHTHTKSQITDFPTSMTPTSHTHTKNQITDFPASMTPTSHATSATTYGKGSNADYGHVMLSDSTSSASNASGGVAATPYAVKQAYDMAKQAQSIYEIGILSDYTGENTVTVNLGRKPKMVIVGNRLGFTNIIVTNGSNTHPGHTVAMPDYPGYYSSISADMSGTKVLEITSNGFTLNKGFEPPLAPFFYLALF